MFRLASRQIVGPGQAGPTSKDPITFEIPGVINLDAAAAANGNIQPDEQMPGMPGTTGSTDYAAAEITTYVQFPAAGTYTMGVNSDDGFRTTAGNVKDIFAAQLIRVTRIARQASRRLWLTAARTS